MDDEPYDRPLQRVPLSSRSRIVPGPLRSVAREPSRLGLALAALGGGAAVVTLGLLLFPGRDGRDGSAVRSTLAEPVRRAPVVAAIEPVAAPQGRPIPEASPVVRQKAAANPDVSSRAVKPPVLTLDLLPVLSREAAEQDYEAAVAQRPRKPNPQR